METAQANIPELVPEKAKKTSPFKKFQGKKLPWKRVLALLIAAGAGWWFFLRPGGNNVQTVGYTAEAAAKRDLTVSVSGTGTVAPIDSYRVGALVTGEILDSPFEEGDRVEKGDLLYRVDAGSAEISLAEAQLALRRDQAAGSQLEDSLTPRASVSGVVQKVYVQEGNQISAGSPIADILDTSVMTLSLPFHAQDAARLSSGQSAQVVLSGTMETLTGTVESVADGNLVSTGGTLTRQVKIRVKNPGALTESTAATATVGGIACAGSGTFQAGHSQTVTAQASGDVTRVNVSVGSKVSAGQALVTLGGASVSTSRTNQSLALEGDQLAIQRAQDDLSNYTILAPISGTVVEKKFKAGDKIESEALSAAGGTLATLYDMSTMTFTMAVNELDINKVAVGQKVIITAGALDGQSFTGVVDKVNINGTTTNGFTTYPVTVRLDQDGDTLVQQGLKPGMNISAQIIGQSVEQALSIPVQAVTRGNTVLVALPGALAEDGVTVVDPTKTEERTLTLGLSDDAYIQVLSGLEEGEVVLISGSGDDSGGAMLAVG